MKREIKVIIAGLLIILLSAVAIFLGLYFYMDSQTEKDVREVARVFLKEMAELEENRFEAIKRIRHTQMDSIRKELEDPEHVSNAEAVYDTLAYAADFQNLSNCTLISPSGHMETVYGDPIIKLGDSAFLMDCLREDRDSIVTGGWSEKEQLIIYASALSVPMANGEMSLGLLWCKPIGFFISIMNLEDPQSLVYYQIIRRDTSYVMEMDPSWEATYEDLMRDHVQPEGMTVEESIQLLHETIASNGIFTMHSHFVDEESGIDMRRSVHAMPLSESNWYLLSIMPYGVLDETISGMGASRSMAMLVGISFFVMILLAVFVQYMQMTRKQIAALEASNTEAKIAQREAEQARESAVAANKAKSEFLSNMSHDIRTPMNAIVGMTAIATDHIDDRKRVQDCLRKINLSGKQLLGLINDVLDMAKIESGKMTLNPEVLSLKQTMETMCDIVRPQIKANGQHFDILISNILSEEVICDSVRINQVLLNFLSNAMKYTPEEGSIQITLWQEESPKGNQYVRTHISVKDTGIGMSEEFRRKLFTAFEREDNLRVQNIQGTGLGLTITKYIVDAMDGTIDVQSAPGKGSTFSFTVDLEKAMVTASEMRLPSWKILVVDDNEELCRTAALSLRELGTRPETCLSGEEAIDHIREAKESGEGYFVVLIDYKMKGMSGVETARKIREMEGDKLPISVISAYDWADIEEEAKDAGITGFIAKPLFKSTLYLGLRIYQDEADGADEQKQEKDIDLTGLRILLAEDNDINAEIACVILEESGCIVDRAEDGAIAVSRFENSDLGYYDAVLMDLRMPHMNGIEATEKIRAMQREDAKKIPIIAITADAFVDDAQKCLEAGMNTHLAKPIDIEQLKKTLAKFT